MPSTIVSQEDHLQVRNKDDYRMFSVVCVLHIVLFNCIGNNICDAFLLGSHPSETEHCGWNEDNCSKTSIWSMPQPNI